MPILPAPAPQARGERAGRVALAPALALALALAALLGGGVAFASDHVPANLLPGIIGEDNRVVVEANRDWPWSALGRVNRRGGGFCTGTLIGERLVLTAAHCLRNRNQGSWFHTDDLHFVAGYNRGEFVAHSAVERVLVADGYRPQGPGPESAEPESAAGLENMTRDWAVLVLRSALPGVRPLARRTIDSRDLAAAIEAGVLVRAGYGQDRPEVLTRHSGCRILGVVRAHALWLNDCDSTRGDSGAPLLLRQGAVTEIVALQIAGNNIRNIAVPAQAFETIAASASPPR